MILPEANDDDTTVIVGNLSEPVCVKVEPAGRWYEALCLRRRHKHSLSQHSLENSSSSESEEDLSEEEEEDEALLLGLDPKEWKEQDHYAVLGLTNKRFRATEEQIKRAYKNKVLKHHPDKRRARGLKVKEGEDDYFTCITRAYEILGIKTKRRSYDSVDHNFDDAIPSINDKSREKFCEVFGPVFEQNARWSNKKRLPKLGDDNSSFDEVNNFYSFWYEFDSWREYSYLDEEEKEKGENRDERRWIEKQNKAARQKRKKEEMARIRQLVDNAYACDPRIQRFKDEEKEKKLAQKRAKQEAAKKRTDEEERLKQEALDEERIKREKEEEESRAQAAVLKKEKDAQKKLIKKERKTLRTVSKELEYFADDESERVTNMADVDRLAELLSLTQLQSLNERMTGDKEKMKEAFINEVAALNAQIEEEKMKQLESLHRHSAGDSGQKGKKEWVDFEISMLIKGVNLFPAGTKDRWEVISNFIKQHVPDSNKNAKDVLAKAKELQKNDLALREDVQKKAFSTFEKENKNASCKPKEGVVSERMESVADQQIRETGSNPATWTAEEQKLLEQALKTFPASVKERWERIAEAVPSRSKKDCMKRYKELVELVRSKKAAQDATAKGKK